MLDSVNCLIGFGLGQRAGIRHETGSFIAAAAAAAAATAAGVGGNDGRIDQSKHPCALVAQPRQQSAHSKAGRNTNTSCDGNSVV